MRIRIAGTTFVEVFARCAPGNGETMNGDLATNKNIASYLGFNVRGLSESHREDQRDVCTDRFEL